VCLWAVCSASHSPHQEQAGPALVQLLCLSGWSFIIAICCVLKIIDNLGVSSQVNTVNLRVGSNCLMPSGGGSIHICSCVQIQ
jgi:hypothetical protein